MVIFHSYVNVYQRVIIINHYTSLCKRLPEGIVYPTWAILGRWIQELAAEGQRFRQQGKLCFELAVRAEALHSEVTDKPAEEWRLVQITYGERHVKRNKIPTYKKVVYQKCFHIFHNFKEWDKDDTGILKTPLILVNNNGFVPSGYDKLDGSFRGTLRELVQ